MLIQLFVGLQGGLYEVEYSFYFARLLFMWTSSTAQLRRSSVQLPVALAQLSGQCWEGGGGAVAASTTGSSVRQAGPRESQGELLP